MWLMVMMVLMVIVPEWGRYGEHKRRQQNFEQNVHPLWLFGSRIV